MLKSKHTIAALIIAPLLSIGGYFVVDGFIAEKPHKAEAGKSYPLVALPGCRYSGGKCTLKNNAFSVEISAAEPGAGVVNLNLTAKYPLQAAKMALVNDPVQAGDPESMRSLDQAGRQWTIALAGSAQPGSQIRLVLVADGAFYFGETGLAFLQTETPLPQDARDGR